jgi:sugar (pentulose or hexulose) kinase
MRGAALIAAVADSFFPFAAGEIERMVPVVARLEPDPAAHDRYRDLFDLYRRFEIENPWPSD